MFYTEIPYESLFLILEITKVMNYEKDLYKLLHYISEQSCKVINSDRCSIFLHDKESNDLYSKVSLKQENEIRVQRGQGIVGYVYETGIPLIIPDAYKDERFHKEIDKITGYKTRNILCYPVKNINGEIIGVFEMINKLDDLDFTNIDIALMDIFSLQAAIAIENSILLLDTIKKERMKMYIPESLVNEIEYDWKKGMEEVAMETITSMFLDFRGFTQLSKKYDPFKILYILNNFFTECEKIIRDTGGEINKFLGDGFLAVFSGKNVTSAIINCLDAAFQINDYLKIFNKKERASLEEELKIGMGIATGEAIIGNVGGIKRGDYSVIGECVNISAKLEKLSKISSISNVIIHNSTNAYISKIYETKIVIKDEALGEVFEVIGLSSDENIEKFLLESSNSDKAEIIEYLGRKNGKKYSSYLLDIYENADSSVKIKILSSLSGFKDISRNVIKKIKDYYDKETDPKVKSKIINVVGRHCSKDDIGFLENQIKDKDSRIRSDAYEALWKFSSVAKIQEMIANFKDTDNRAKASATIILSKFDILESVKIIREMLNSANTAMKYSGAYALANIGRFYDSEKIIFKLENQEVRHRKEAAEIVEQTIPRLIELLDDFDDKVIARAINALGSLRNKKAVFPLIKLMDRIEKKHYKLIINAITEIGIDEALYHLILKNLGSV